MGTSGRITNSSPHIKTYAHSYTNSRRFNGVLELALVLLLLLGCTACALTAASWADMGGGPSKVSFGSRTPG